MDVGGLLDLLDDAARKWGSAAADPMNVDPGYAAGQAALYARFGMITLSRAAARDPRLAAEVTAMWEEIPGAV